MKISTTRFGEIEIPQERVYTFPEGILGFAEVKQYCIIDNPGGGPFQWLQAVKQPSLAFVICDPRLFMPDYKVAVTREDLASIQLEDVKDGIVMVIVTVRPDPAQMTANLMGPLVFNVKLRLAKQLVLTTPGYTTRHKIFKPEDAHRAGTD
jgi:flagellar assembly factor FliW